jgi:Arc/MetJ-type ribon-helix-helix transcriptional regulator
MGRTSLTLGTILKILGYSVSEGRFKNASEVIRAGSD